MSVDVSNPPSFDDRTPEPVLSNDKEKSEHTSIEIPGAGHPPPLTQRQKILILFLLCPAQFFDIFNSVSVVIALPQIQQDLNFTPGAIQWVLSGYTLTFAAFLLSAGRLSDIWHPKPVFCAGFLIAGISSVICGVSVNPIMLIVFRAVQGVGASMTLPSAIAIIATNFPDPVEQGRALAIFGSCGAIGNVVGFIVGGIIAARASWHWVFYVVAIFVIPFSVVSYFLLPRHEVDQSNKGRSLDWPGVSVLTGGLILFVYAISDANHVGWGKPQIIITLIFSVIFVAVFLVIERYVKDPALPPRTWTNKNFLPLFIYTLSAYWFLLGTELTLVQVFQDLFGWSAINAAVHCIPIGVLGGASAIGTGFFAPYVPPRVLLIGSQVLMSIGAILFALADTRERYWSYIFPGMIVSMPGCGMAYIAANIVIMAGARKGEEGVVGAVMNTSFQLGATIGVAVLTAVSLGVNLHQPTDPLSQHKGYAAAFWSMLGMHLLVIIITVLFVHPPRTK